MLGRALACCYLSSDVDVDVARLEFPSESDAAFSLSTKVKGKIEVHLSGFFEGVEIPDDYEESDEDGEEDEDDVRMDTTHPHDTTRPHTCCCFTVAVDVAALLYVEARRFVCMVAHLVAHAAKKKKKLVCEQRQRNFPPEDKPGLFACAGTDGVLLDAGGGR